MSQGESESEFRHINHVFGRFGLHRIKVTALSFYGQRDAAETTGATDFVDVLGSKHRDAQSIRV